jgi:23S rRNA (adenine2503-C2)-methyltransferase
MEQTAAFLAELRAHGTVAHLRRARGPDIDAACGQLRKREATAGRMNSALTKPARDTHA